MSRRGLISAAVLAAVVASACGGSDSDSSPAAATPMSSESTPANAPLAGEQIDELAPQDSAAPSTAAIVPPTTTTIADPAVTEPRVTTTTLPYDTSRYYELSFNYGTYLCRSDPVIDECVTYFGGPAPLMVDPDLYCEPYTQLCTEYDPSQYEEVRYAGDSFLCDLNTFGGGFDCVRYSGGSAPSFFAVDLYCSGMLRPSECSPLWYPDELSRYEFVTIDRRDYLCEDAFTGRFVDLDCFRYDGGDPHFQVMGFPDLYCSDDLGRLSCDTSYYPSEWEGLELVRIDYQDYVCTTGYRGQECYRWWGSGSPADATFGRPDYYCNSRGCSPDGYP